MFQFLQRALRSLRSDTFDRFDPEGAGGFDYLKLASRCGTQNSFNRLHIELENVCTPVELASVASLARHRRFPQQGRNWLEKLHRWKPELFDAPHPYQRRAFGRWIFLYQDPRSEPRNKGLLIAFTGNARRLLMPISVFLQFVDPVQWDVLVLTKNEDSSFLEGLEEISGDFPGLIEHVERTFSPTQYRRVITLGTSSGGFPAIWAALLVDAKRGISVGGFPPDPVPSGAARNKAAARSPDLCYVYGGDFLHDYHSALVLQNLCGGRLLAVRDVGKHNVLGVLMKRGQLAEFLDQILS